MDADVVIVGAGLAGLSAAAATAAPTPPPAVSTDSAANCAEPANTMADIAMAAASGMPASRARIPKEADSRNPAMANGTPARRPLRKEARSSAVILDRMIPDTRGCRSWTRMSWSSAPASPA